jgi:hypothetical protein
VFCTSAIIILSAIAGVLGWVALHQRTAMNAQKEALEATKATVEALKTQSDLKFEPMKETISSKDAAIQALEAQLSTAVERKTLAEEKMSASQEHLNQLLASLPAEMSRTIQAEVQKERLSTTRAAGTLFFNFGYYLGVMNLSGLILQIQSLTFARLDKENVSPTDYPTRAGVEYMKDSVLFLYRERRVAMERLFGFLCSPGIVQTPNVITENLEKLNSADKMIRERGMVMDSEVDALSSMQGFPLELP